MSANQLNMMMQMVSQSYNKPAAVNQNKGGNDKDSFKDLMDKKVTDDKSQKPAKKDEPLKTNDKTEKPQENTTDDTAQKQILVANMLMSQNIVQPMVQDISANNQPNVQQLVQPLVQNADVSANAEQMVQNIQTQQTEGNEIIKPQNMQQQAVNTNELNEALKPEKNAANQQQNAFEEIVTPQQTKQVQTTENSQLGNNMQETKQSNASAESNANVKTESEPTGEMQTPLFKDVQSTPVKVGETTQTLDTQSPDMEEKLKDIIKYNIKNVGDKVEIQLNPHNLGKITIELAEKDGLTSVLITAENHKTMSLLAQHAGGIESLMQDKLAQPVHVYVEQQTPQQYDDSSRQQRQQQNNQQNQNQSKDEQQSFVEQLRLGLLNIR